MSKMIFPTLSILALLLLEISCIAVIPSRNVRLSQTSYCPLHF